MLSLTRGFGVAFSSPPSRDSNDQLSQKEMRSCGGGGGVTQNDNGVEAKPTEAGVSMHEQRQKFPPKQTIHLHPRDRKGFRRIRRSPLEPNKPVPLQPHHSLAITTTRSPRHRSSSTSSSGYSSMIEAQSPNLARNRTGSAFWDGLKSKKGAPSTGVEGGVA